MTEGFVRGLLKGMVIALPLWSEISGPAPFASDKGPTAGPVNDAAKRAPCESVAIVGLVPGCSWLVDTSAKGDRGESIDPMLAVLGSSCIVSAVVLWESFGITPAMVGGASAKGDRCKSFDPIEVGAIGW